MAGIGFRLSQALSSEDVYTKLRAVVASVLLSSGPWLCTILSIAAIGMTASASADPHQQDVFRVIINYSYAGSLILFSIVELVTTRYLADALFLRQEKVVPSLFSNLAATTVLVSSAASLIFYSFTDLPFPLVIASSCLFVSISLIWCSMIFLSACKGYGAITLAFLLGMCTSILGAYFLGETDAWGMPGRLVGFTLGQLLTAALLSRRIFVEFGTDYMPPRDYFLHCSNNRVFIFVGLFYALSIWVDKVIFWVSPDTSEYVAPLMYKSTAYDSSIFLAYTTIIPSMTYFLVSVETSFYNVYRRYYSMVDNRAPLYLINENRLALIEVLKDNIAGLVILQAFVTLPVWIFATEIFNLFNLPLIYVTIFRYGLLGVSVHVFMLFVNIIILYFDMPKHVFWNYGLFLALNGVLTLLSTHFEYRYHGLGYAVAALVSLVVSVLRLNKVVSDLNYLTFMKQPISPPTHIPLELNRVNLKS